MNASKPSRVLTLRGAVITILSGPEAGYTLIDCHAPSGFAGV
jgi:hypothetical protein